MDGSVFANLDLVIHSFRPKKTVDSAKAMKRILFFLVCVLVVAGLQAQGDIPTTKPLEIGKKNNLDALSAKKGTFLNMPSVLDEKLVKPKKGVNMLPQKQLVQAGHGMKIDPKIAQGEGQKNKPTGDVHLGDIVTDSRQVVLHLRDHGRVDGDRVMTLLNKDIIEYNKVLAGSFKTLTVTLKDGFNTVEFQALNQGFEGLNTSQFVVTDEQNRVLYNNGWYLSTNSKASIIIVKTPTLENPLEKKEKKTEKEEESN